MKSTLGFFTQNEIDLVVGNKRRRERLEGGVLPRGARVKTFGQAPIIFPEFAAAGLLVERPSPTDAPLLARMTETSQRLYESPNFQAMADVLRTALYRRKGWTLTDLSVILTERARGDLLAWRLEVKDAEDSLARLGIVTRFEVGRLEGITDVGYRVALADTGEVITCAVNAARVRLPVGAWVTRTVAELGARKGEVLVPTVDPAVLAPMGENHPAVVEEEAGWDEMLANVGFAPAVVPYVGETAAENESDGDVIRPKRRVRVIVNRALYANANTMARGQRPTLRE